MSPSFRLTRSSLAGALLGLFVLTVRISASAQQVPVRHVQGTSHGFLLVREMNGRAIGSGDSTQIVRGNQVISRLVFHFTDGSIDDETTIFSQKHFFHLVSDHHLQKGPQYSKPMDLFLNATTGQVIVRALSGKDQAAKTYHVDMPPDVSNGLVLTLLTNILPSAPETKVSFLAATPKPRMVKLAITPEGKDTFSIGGTRHHAVRYVIKVDLGGVAGLVAQVIGKQPKDVRVWVVEGLAPTFIRMEGPLADGGQVLQIEQTSPTWK